MQFGSVDLLPPWCRSSVSGRGRQKSEEQWQKEIQDGFAWKSSSDRLPSQSAAKKTPEKKFAEWLNHVRNRRNIPDRLRAQWDECCPELFDQNVHEASSSKEVPNPRSGARDLPKEEDDVDDLTQAQQRCLALTTLPVNPTLCVARTWRGAQCSNKRLKVGELCSQHKNLALKYGHYDSVLSQDEALEYAMKAASYVRPFVCRYYCRTKMWDEADALGLDCVEAMSDEQYDVALRSVHKYFVYHPAQRKMWALEEDHGPVDVSERHTDKAMYTGGARKFKLVSYIQCWFSNPQVQVR